jgi:hypothetical protein
MNAPVLEELANALLAAETLAGTQLELLLAKTVDWAEPLVEDTNGRAPVLLREAVLASDSDE